MFALLRETIDVLFSRLGYTRTDQCVQMNSREALILYSLAGEAWEQELNERQGMISIIPALNYDTDLLIDEAEQLIERVREASDRGPRPARARNMSLSCNGAIAR